MVLFCLFVEVGSFLVTFCRPLCWQSGYRVSKASPHVAISGDLTQRTGMGTQLSPGGATTFAKSHQQSHICSHDTVQAIVRVMDSVWTIPSHKQHKQTALTTHRTQKCPSMVGISFCSSSNGCSKTPEHWYFLHGSSVNRYTFNSLSSHSIRKVHEGSHLRSLPWFHDYVSS